MSGNTFGKSLRITTFGESHGRAIGCVIDGFPPRFEIDTELMQRELDRRRPGSSRHVTQRREADEAQILSGTLDGVTTGAPIAIAIFNEDQRPQDYDEIKDKFRPGHADFTYWKKYGIRDHRGGGRSSARETAARVAAGALAKQWLGREFNARVRGFLAAMGGTEIPFKSWEDAASNPFSAADTSIIPTLESLIEELRREGDSCGASIRVVADGVPAGLGEPVFDRLDADIAKALMSINAVKGVEIGDGFASVAQKGSEHADEISDSGFASNHAGGILGGISTGQDIVATLAVKPTSSIRKERATVDKGGKNTTVSTTGRHDPCVGIRAVPIAEAMMALTLMDHALRDRAQCGETSRKSEHTGS